MSSRSQSSHRSNKSGDFSQFFIEVARLKNEFTKLYGGENSARFLLHSGITTFQPSGRRENQTDIPYGLTHTATRILNAKCNNRPFKVSFAGYSVTVGRGNYFHQSYPFVLEKLLKKPMSFLGITLQIRNAAIGGVPSFPYGWCLENFLGEDVDVISWDFSMNEAGGVPNGLEAYIRHAMTLRRKPMMIVKDTGRNIAARRRELLQDYVDFGVLKDPVVLSIEDAMEEFATLSEDMLPIGLREWRKFGAPKGAPGQAPHHPGVKEHELLGWLLAMHFLASLELVASDLVMDANVDKDPYNLVMPPPIYSKNVNPSELLSLFFGTEISSHNATPMSWEMGPVYCRTTYDPILNGKLQDMVRSGSLGEDLDVMLPRGAKFYKHGWVLDLGKSEKLAKKMLQRYGGLGYIDSKQAYYGIYGSGSLELFIPCLGRDDISQSMENEDMVKHRARDCFKHLVRLDKDVSFRVGGVLSEITKPINMTGTSYWGRNICFDVDVPSKSILSNLGKSKETGIMIEVSVETASVMVNTGPCSLSHIIWQQLSSAKMNGSPNLSTLK